MKLFYIIDKKYDLQFAGNKLATQDLNKQYSALGNILKYTAKEYQKSWNKINCDFSLYIEKVTGYNWFYKNYYCVVSPTHAGISNWGYGNKVIRWWKENAYIQRRITAHELILSHYFEIYRHHFSQHKLSDGQVWALAEICAFTLTSLTPEVKKFWPWDTNGYYYSHNYPQLVSLQKTMKSIFLSRRNFNDYIVKGIKLVEKQKNIVP